MAFTVDYSTVRGKVRLLIQDTDAESPIFTDEEIDSFLGLEGDRVKSGAALALETIASRQALVLKVMRTLDFQMDGSKVAESLMKAAQRLRDLDQDADWYGFDIAEQTDNSLAAAEEFLLKQYIQELA